MLFLLTLSYILVAAYSQNDVYKDCKSAMLHNKKYSSTFTIKPDADSDSFVVNCYRSGNKYITEVPHNYANDSIITGYEARLSYVGKLHYHHANSASKIVKIPSLKALVDQAQYCSQYVRITCHNSIYVDSGVRDRNGNVIPYFAGGNDNSRCACGITGSCFNTGKKCNCDCNCKKTLEDEGYYTQKNLLPLQAVLGGDTGSSSEWLKFRVGNLICWDFAIGQWSNWSGYEACSATCQADPASPPTQTRSRTCNNVTFGSDCPGRNVDSRPCNVNVTCPDCDSPIGISDGSIKDSQFSASSYTKDHEPYLARLNNTGAWCTETTDRKLYIKVDLIDLYRITGVAVQRSNHDIKRFSIFYPKGQRMKSYKAHVDGPVGRNDSIVKVHRKNVKTSVIVIKLYESSCLRMELYGCKEISPTEVPNHCRKNNTCSHICENEATKAVCKCLTGFELQADGKTCHDINECDSGACGDNSQCKNLNGSFSCNCDAGFTMNNNTGLCEDNNECQLGTDPCDPHTSNCKNTPGSYVCECKPGFKKNVVTGLCEDNNECQLGTDPCDPHTSNCKNTPGSYVCECKPGFKNNVVTGLCEDNNECQLATDLCDRHTSNCRNTPGSYVCKCKPGFKKNVTAGLCEDIDECSLQTAGCDAGSTNCINTDGGYECKCNHPGLEKEQYNRHKCVDIDECKSGNGGCDHICTNKIKYFYECSCYAGYTLDARDNKTCIDNDECAKVNTNDCHQKTTTCENTPGAYRCNCRSGLKHAFPDSHYCNDIDECEQQNGGCAQICTNLFRSFICGCRPGFRLRDDRYGCRDINECTEKLDNCTDVCRNYFGGYFCDCSTGYKLNDDKRTCSDFNECASNHGKGPCEHGCGNTVGSYQCLCPKNYHLAPDRVRCRDDDECALKTDNCDKSTSRCVNAPGSFQCRCITGFVKNTATGLCEAIKCPVPQSIAHGAIFPDRCMGGTNKYRDVCSYKCNDGYEMHSQSVSNITCDSDGNWNTNGGFQAFCQRIRCGRLSSVPNGYLTPSSCKTNDGVKYEETCRLYCNSGHYRTGREEVTCQKDRSYDGDFSQTKCSPRVKLICPSNVNIVLPLGKSEMSLPLDKLDVKLDLKKVRSVPDGVLTGKYKFAPASHSQGVTLKMYSPGYGDVECRFQVSIEDREPPTITNCPTKDIFVTLTTPTGRVTWPEPSFKDNVGVNKVIKNIENNQMLAQQVYFVYYSAIDLHGNKATCRFFVHVKARFCSKSTRPGGEGAQVRHLSNNMVFLLCLQGKTFDRNVTGFAVFTCRNGIWQDVPDCVDFYPKNGACQDGYVTTLSDKKLLQCAKCPKGTAFSTTSKTCQKCPKGFYQDKEGAMSCEKCPSGTTSDREGLKDKKHCQAQCQPGKYSSTGLLGSKGCERCPDGSYQSLHGQQSCQLCHAGSRTVPGATSEDQCLLPARVSRVFPETEISAVEGDTVIIECYGTGSPSPYMTIKNATDLGPASSRGKASLQQVATGNRYMSGTKLTITHVTINDTAIYKCTANNQKGSSGGIDEREIRLEVGAKV